jgi:hypothetical protein
MPRTGKCLNNAGCLLASRNEIITLEAGEPFDCPECKKPLIDARPASGRKPMAVQYFILGGISMLVLSGAGAVYWQVRKISEKAPPGQIGTSFEQAQIAGEQGQFLPSRHMAVASPTPAASPAPAAASPATAGSP